MSNTFAQDAMMTIFEKTLEGVDNKSKLTKDLTVYKMGDEHGQRSGDTDHIPQEIMLDGGEGIETDDTDVEDVIERLVPISRNFAVHAVVDITTKQLRDEYRVGKVIESMSRTLSNRADKYAYNRMIEQASMSTISTGDMTSTDITLIDNKFDMRGYSDFDRKAFYSGSDYSALADSFALKTYSDKRTTDALERSRLQPILGRFESFKADYNINFAAAALTAGITVTANTSHTVATYTDSSNTVYKDNRRGLITFTGVLAGEIALGMKFNIANVFALNENPGIKEETGELQDFTIVSIETDGSIYGISPAIVIDGPYRNCDAQAAAGAAVTVLNEFASQPSMFYLPESTVIIPGMLPATDDGITVTAGTTEQGLPMRLTKFYYQGSEKLRLKMLLYFDVSVLQGNMINLHMSNQS